MGKLEQAAKVGLRDKTSQQIVAVYPLKAEGNDEEITQAVRDWYYKQSCGAEDQLVTLYVDALTEQEIKQRA